jgi:hypothetical protein
MVDVGMERRRRTQLDIQLCELFLEHDREEVLSWLVGSENRRVVIVVGAGFSKNAIYRQNGEPAHSAVKLWDEVTNALNADLGISGSVYEPTVIADLYRHNFPANYPDKMRRQVSDEKIHPGEAHKALFGTDNLAAVITTNQLDTLLDHGTHEHEGQWTKIVKDSDFAQSKADTGTQLIYIHGHRSDDSTWVFTRSDYEDIATKKPVMMARTKQLLGQHPVLFVGFSLADPNFHALVRVTEREFGGQSAKALAIMIDRPDKSFSDYWKRRGVTIATFRTKDGLPSLFKKIFWIISQNRGGGPFNPNAGPLDDLEKDIEECSFPELQLDRLKSWIQMKLETQHPLPTPDALLETWVKIAVPNDETRHSFHIHTHRLTKEQAKAYEKQSTLSAGERAFSPDLKHLPANRFPSNIYIYQIADWYRETHGVSSWHFLGRWLLVTGLVGLYRLACHAERCTIGDGRRYGKYHIVRLALCC